MVRRVADQIIEDMKALVGSDDTESAHSKADDLLIEGLFSLASYCDETRTTPEPIMRRTRRLVRAYRAITKWYA